MKAPYTGEERRKLPLLELMGKRVTLLELGADRQAEVLELAVQHLRTEQRVLQKEMTDLKDICRSCVCFQQDDFR